MCVSAWVYQVRSLFQKREKVKFEKYMFSVREEYLGDRRWCQEQDENGETTSKRLVKRIEKGTAKKSRRKSLLKKQREREAQEEGCGWSEKEDGEDTSDLGTFCTPLQLKTFGHCHWKICHIY